MEIKMGTRNKKAGEEEKEEEKSRWKGNKARKGRGKER